MAIFQIATWSTFLSVLCILNSFSEKKTYTRSMFTIDKVLYSQNLWPTRLINYVFFERIFHVLKLGVYEFELHVCHSIRTSFSFYPGKETGGELQTFELTRSIGSNWCQIPPKDLTIIHSRSQRPRYEKRDFLLNWSKTRNKDKLGFGS